MKTPTRTTQLPLLLVLVSTLAFAACTSAGGAPSGGPSASPATAPAPTPVGGGTSGNPGTGVGVGVNPAPVDPGAGQAPIVMPKPGQLNPHPVAVTSLEPAVDGRHVIVRVTWWSGVEPCHVFDSIKVERVGNDIALTVFEGTGDPNAACIEIAQQKATIVDLGELEPGENTIAAPGGEAPPVTVTVA